MASRKRNPVLEAVDLHNAETGGPVGQSGNRFPDVNLAGVRHWAHPAGVIFPEVDLPGSTIHLFASNHAPHAAEPALCGADMGKGVVQVVAHLDHPRMCGACLALRAKSRQVCAPLLVVA